MLKVIIFALISSLSISNHWIRNLRLYINNLTLISRSSMTLHEFGESFAHSGIHRELVNILKEIRVISDKIRSEDYAANIENDWKFAAMVLDRQGEYLDTCRSFEQKLDQLTRTFISSRRLFFPYFISLQNIAAWSGSA